LKPKPSFVLFSTGNPGDDLDGDLGRIRKQFGLAQ